MNKEGKYCRKEKARHMVTGFKYKIFILAR